MLYEVITVFIMAQQIEQKESEIIEINSKIRTLSRSLDLARQELNISRPLAKDGIVSQVDIIKLERQVNEMRGELENTRLLLPKQNSQLREAILKRKDVALKFRVDAQAELEGNRITSYNVCYTKLLRCFLWRWGNLWRRKLSCRFRADGWPLP